MNNITKGMRIPFAALLLVLSLAASAKADLVENLTFNGTGTCNDPTCTGFGNGPVTVSYSLDFTTQTIVGSWSATTPFGSFSSATNGASATIANRFGDLNPAFVVVRSSPNFLEFVQFFFLGSDTTELGPLDTVTISDACYDQSTAATAACRPGYTVTGRNTLISSVNTPEPGSLALLGTGLIGTLLYWRKRPLSSR